MAGHTEVPADRAIIDVHSHCFTGRQHGDEVVRGVDRLRRAGLRNMVVLGLVNTHLDSNDMWGLIPDYVENRGDPLFNEVDDLLELTRLTGQVFVPFVDTRHMREDVAPALKGYLEQGFRGIKGIYLADRENDLGVRGVPDTLGISLQQYQRREWEIFSFAQTHDLPLLYHMDTRRHGDVMKALLDDFPLIRVDFAHLGIGRKAFGAILDRYPNVYTDIAGLLPHIRENLDSYRDFITHYADRVCFGTDAVLYQPEVVLDYIDMVLDLKLPGDVEAGLFFHNPVRFLGNALSGRETVCQGTAVSAPPASEKEVNYDLTDKLV